MSRLLFDTIVKSRFIYDQSFSIYGGMSGLYDLGPIGCNIQKNLINEWRKFFVLKDKMLEVDCSMLTPEMALKASGHLSKFNDLMVKDSITNQSYRVDHLLISELEKIKPKANNEKQSELNEALKKLNNSNIDDIKLIISKFKIKAPNTGNELTTPTPYNLMFQTQFGSANKANTYLRPETAQGIFSNFKRLYTYNQQKLPLIVAQVGKSFRNEISPKNGLLRQREFLMAEIEHFLHPNKKYKRYEKFPLVEHLNVPLLSSDKQSKKEAGNAPIKISLRDAVDKRIVKSETLAYYIGRVYEFVRNCGVDPNKVRFRQHLDDEMAHYANECWDLECETSYGWTECVGIADRCGYDLLQHSLFSTQDFSIGKVFKKDTNIKDEKKSGTVIKLNNENLSNFLSKLKPKEAELFVSYLNKQPDEFAEQLNELRRDDKIDKIRIKIKNEKAFHIKREDLNEIIEINSLRDQLADENIYPHVIEPSFGIARIMYTILEHNFKARDKDATKYYFSLPVSIAPYSCVILPFLASHEYEVYANKIYNIYVLTVIYQKRMKKLNVTLNKADLLIENDISVRVDDMACNIGKRYWRADEIGIKYAITLDDETLKNKGQTVTLRERDSKAQIKIKFDDILPIMNGLIKKNEPWENIISKYKISLI